ncbi:MAG: sugar ABC transporter permease, partial [Anaerolineae bacterium]|nr:sugar ABC transporter permease [Anaerolineae bacterium]
MSLSSHTDPTAHQKAKRSPIPAYLVGGLLILIGIMAVVGFVISVSQDDGIQLALNWTASEEYPEQPSVLLAFLAQFGIVLPLLVAYLSIFFISIGAQVLGGSLRAAHWAQVAYMWLTIGMGITILLTIYNTIRVANEDGVAVDVGALLGSIVLPFLAMIIVGGVWWWLSNHIGMYFEGEDLLIARETRLAWNLLIPTLAIFILVAARPLEQTFIRSLTDKRFAGRGVPQFVGLDNYANLLTVRL